MKIDYEIKLAKAERDLDKQVQNVMEALVSNIDESLASNTLTKLKKILPKHAEENKNIQESVDTTSAEWLMFIHSPLVEAILEFDYTGKAIERMRSDDKFNLDETVVFGTRITRNGKAEALSEAARKCEFAKEDILKGIDLRENFEKLVRNIIVLEKNAIYDRIMSVRANSLTNLEDDAAELDKKYKDGKISAEEYKNERSKIHSAANNIGAAGLDKEAIYAAEDGN